MRTSWVSDEQMNAVLLALMPENRLVMKCCIVSGLRISDVLTMRTDQLRRRMTIRESKTGKSRRVTWPQPIYDELQRIAGRRWVFEGRSDWRKHRSRQAVYKDVNKAAAAFKRTGAIPARAVVAPHSARKMAAVKAYQSGGLDAAQRLLNHSDPKVTLIYALADQLRDQKGGARNGGKGKRKARL